MHAIFSFHMFCQSMKLNLLKQNPFSVYKLNRPPQKILQQGDDVLLYAPAIKSPTMCCGCFSDFVEQIKKLYSDISLEEIAKTIKGNFINQGSESSVYEIKGLKKYLLLVKRDCAKPSGELKAIKNSYYGQNFGQPVAQTDDGLKILLKAEGEPFSVKKWTSYYEGIKKITPKQGERFLNDIENLSSFPQKSFDDLAKRIKLLYINCEKSIDPINPNNFLVDYKNKNINLVDVGEICSYDKRHFSVKDLMCSPLTDNRLRYDYLKVFDEKQKESYTKCSKIIEEKCQKAYEKYNLAEIGEKLNQQ